MFPPPGEVKEGEGIRAREKERERERELFCKMKSVKTHYKLHKF